MLVADQRGIVRSKGSFQLSASPLLLKRGGELYMKSMEVKTNDAVSFGVTLLLHRIQHLILSPRRG